MRIPDAFVCVPAGACSRKVSAGSSGGEPAHPIPGDSVMTQEHKSTCTHTCTVAKKNLLLIQHVYI